MNKKYNLLKFLIIQFQMDSMASSFNHLSPIIWIGLARTTVFATTFGVWYGVQYGSIDHITLPPNELLYVLL